MKTLNNNELNADQLKKINKKLETQLIGSCGSLQVLQEDINKYFYSNSYKLVMSDVPNQWDVVKDNGDKLKGYRVILKKNRYRFEFIKY